MIKVDDGNTVIVGDVPSAAVDASMAICGFLEMVTKKYSEKAAYIVFEAVLKTALDLFEARQHRKEES